MSTTNKLKIFNDPIYGFITIPNALIYDLIQHPYFQRLRRISQMGMSYLVYPGAHHTRFHHALGSLHLMQKAVYNLRFKGVEISKEEENAVYIAILLHDIGHGPFSHAMEHSIVEEVHHEEISLFFMEKLNKEFNNKLALGIQIFKNNYPRTFLHQLISSQIDMDRLDYLKRDSFYSGVAEGNINSERLIQMMNVANDVLVIEEKGVYSVEKFLIARRLMYWQTYLHKTGVVAELILTRILKRAKELTHKGVVLESSKPLRYFLENKITATNFSETTLQTFALLDDYDIMSAIKTWQFHTDYVLSTLSSMIINRELLKIKYTTEKPLKQEVTNYVEKIMATKNIAKKEASYFAFRGKIKNQAYNKSEPICVRLKNGKIVEIITIPTQLHLKFLAKEVKQHFICYPKTV